MCPSSKAKESTYFFSAGKKTETCPAIQISPKQFTYEYKNRMGEMEKLVTVSATSQNWNFYEMPLI